MSYRISTELPASGVVALTEVYRADAPNGVYRVVDVLAGPAPSDGRRFVFDDPSGAVDKFYRVVFYDAAQVVLRDSGPFSPNTVGGPDLGTLVRLDHNRSLNGEGNRADALRYVAGGAGVSDVPIRVYRAADFDAGRTDLALAVTRTDDEGRWAAPVFVEAGQTYVVLFYKAGLYGPDAVRVVV